MIRWNKLVGPILAAALAVSLAARASAPPGRYTISGGTVLDNKTKLTWQQQTPAALYSWAGAKTFCAGLGSGWRLPTIKELTTLIDYSQGTPPVIDTTAFPGIPVNYFWSSTPMAGSSTYAWNLYFYFGNPHVNPLTDTLNVLCVR